MLRRGAHIREPHGIYFLTFTIVGWADLFTRQQCRTIIIDALRHCKISKGLLLYGYVIMSNHMHLIAATRKESEGMSVFIRDFKKFTARQLIEWFKTSKQESRKEWVTAILGQYGTANPANETYQVWSNDNHPVLIYSPKFARQKLNYIHMNPVKAGIVDSPEDYIYSSARNYAGRRDYILEVEMLDLIFME